MLKKVLYLLLAFVIIALIAVTGGSLYLVEYALSPDDNRHDTDSIYALLFERYPDIETWTDSMRSHHLLRDTAITQPNGLNAHALYLRADSAHGRTAIIIHGYRDTKEKYLFLGRMYHRDLGYNILMPDLHAHGQSEGDAIQMGWYDRHDVAHWVGVAEEMFRDSCHASNVVVHGVSMGAATAICVAGDSMPDYVRCYVEDCSYTSAWDEFAYQLKEQFGLPIFPLLYTSSLVCRLRFGWFFDDASPVKMLEQCHAPMLFIHGGADTYTPPTMEGALYDAKPDNKEMWVAPEAEHAESYKDHPAEYTACVKAFIDKYITLP